MKFYSDVTKKLYETEEALKAAEKAVDEANQKKEQAAQQKKADASKVEDAFKNRNAARREYNTKVVEARKIYNAAITEAKKAFEESLAAATNLKDKAEEVYNTALKEFTDKHDSYHMTLKDGDNVVTISNSSDKNFENLGKEYNSLLDTLLNFWKF